MALCSCFGPSKAERREADRIESQDARSRAAEAAQKRQQQYEKSAAGKAAKAQMAAAAKQSQASNKGEPVLKWQMGFHKCGGRLKYVEFEVVDLFAQIKKLCEEQSFANRAM